MIITLAAIVVNSQYLKIVSFVSINFLSSSVKFFNCDGAQSELSRENDFVPSEAITDSTDIPKEVGNQQVPKQVSLNIHL